MNPNKSPRLTVRLSWFNATMAASGLDADQDAWRNEFPETTGSTFTAQERSDVRNNMMDQLDATNFPTLTFKAHDLTTLDGTGTAPVDIAIKGGTSTSTLSATATWDGATLTEEQAAQVVAGQWYVNVMTLQYPGGEIRGQLIPLKK